MAIVNAQLTTTQLDLLTVPASKTYAVTNILVCNTYDPDAADAATKDAKFDMHLIPSGEPLSLNKTTVVRQLTLPAGETFTFDSERVILDVGDKISFVAEPDIGSGNTNLAATISYLEV